MHQHSDPSPALLHHYALRRVLEPPLPHQLEEQRRVLAPGVGEDGLAARREKPRHEIREGRSAPSLVEHVGGENEVEGPEPLHVVRVPVEERGLRFPAQVSPGVADREVEGGFVVVGRENSCPTREGCDGGESDTAAELDGAPAGQVFARERAGQGDRARPEFGPVGEPLVALEISLVYEGVGRGRVQDAVSIVCDLDDGFEEPCAAAEVRP